MGWYFWLIEIGTSIWVLIDAKRIGVKKGQIQGMGNLGPWGWFFFCLLLWFVGFPFYVAKRSEFKRINEEQQQGGIKVASPQKAKNLPDNSKDYATESVAIICLGVLCFVGGFAFIEILNLKFCIVSGLILMWAGTIIGLCSISPQRKLGYAWVSIFIFPLLMLASYFVLLALLWGDKP